MTGFFAQFFQLREQASVTLNSDRMTDDFYGSFTRAHYCPPGCSNLIIMRCSCLSGQVPYDAIMEIIEHSYETIVKKLQRKG